MEFVVMFLTLLAGHFVCDYVLQGDAIAIGKNRNVDPCRFGVDWWYWLTSHAVTHAVAVSLVTGSVALGVVEFVLHWAIDFGKCEKIYNLHVDQALHVLCKLLWVIFIL